MQLFEVPDTDVSHASHCHADTSPARPYDARIASTELAMKRKRNWAFVALVVVLLAIIVVGALRWRNQMRPASVDPALSSGAATATP